MTSPALVARTTSGLHEFLGARVSSIPKDTPILDVGCGTGAWLERLANLGFNDLSGVDIDPAQFGCHRAAFSKMDLDRETGELGNRKFGLITAIEVIEHLENPGHLWSLVSRHLAQEGRFLLTTPNIQSLNSRLRFLMTGALPAFDSKGDPTHIQPMYLEGAIRVMTRYGLRIEEIWVYPARGSRVFRRSVSLTARVLSILISDDVPGDNICLAIRRSAQ